MIKARRPALDRIPNHSAQVAQTKPIVSKSNDKTVRSSGKKSITSQPQGRKVVHSTREPPAKPASHGRKVSFTEPAPKPKWTDQSRAAMFNPAIHCQYCYDLLGRVFDHKASECCRSKASHSAHFSEHMSYMADHHVLGRPTTDVTPPDGLPLPRRTRPLLQLLILPPRERQF